MLVLVLVVVRERRGGGSGGGGGRGSGSFSLVLGRGGEEERVDGGVAGEVEEEQFCTAKVSEVAGPGFSVPVEEEFVADTEAEGLAVEVGSGDAEEGRVDLGQSGEDAMVVGSMEDDALEALCGH